MKFGRYQIIKQIGQGGMGDVYRAHDSQIEREVALKVLLAGAIENATIRERFEREARLIARLEHKAIVPIYDYGVDNGRPYIVMKLMQGGSLADKLKWGGLPAAQAVSVLQRICAALDRVHANNIIHRDLKPANILFDEEGMPFLADFGIAHLTEGTQTRSQIGTYQYMAPEQSRGGLLDRRTDIYQMGIVFFELLTGRKPFMGDTPHALVVQHDKEPLPPVRSLNPALFPGYDMVLAKATAKNPADRYATAGAFATAVANVESASPLAGANELTPSVTLIYKPDASVENVLLLSLETTLGILRLALEATTLPLRISIPALLHNMGSQQQQEILAKLEEMRNHGPNLSRHLPHLVDDIHRRFQFLVDMGEIEALQILYDKVKFLLSINTLLQDDNLHHLHLELVDNTLVEAIQTWHFEPNHILVGNNELPDPISFTPDPHRLLKACQIAHDPQTGLPIITINLPSKPINSVWEHRRTNWTQSASSEFDLDVYDVRDRPLGQIVTRKLDLPYQVVTKQVTLQFSPHLPFHLIQTRVIDEKDSPVAVCVKLTKRDLAV
jgi:serine/threonine protein kinase